jgi:hypothetical protein
MMMNKKIKAQLELSTEMHRELTKDDCSTCRQHFQSLVSRDAHRKLYPSHFDSALPQKPVQVDAVPETKISRYKRMKMVEE